VNDYFQMCGLGRKIFVDWTEYFASEWFGVSAISNTFRTNYWYLEIMYKFEVSFGGEMLVFMIYLCPADNGCLVWGGSSCGKRGNCMLYNGEQLRYIFNLTAAGNSIMPQH
jgi:hypothetical protein